MGLSCLFGITLTNYLRWNYQQALSCDILYLYLVSILLSSLVVGIYPFRMGDYCNQHRTFSCGIHAYLVALLLQFFLKFCALSLTKALLFLKERLTDKWAMQPVDIG